MTHPSQHTTTMPDKVAYLLNNPIDPAVADVAVFGIPNAERDPYWATA